MYAFRAMQASGGWSVDRFLPSDRTDAFLCAICREVCREAVSINCGHTFCNECMNKSSQYYHNQCPQCRAIILNVVPAFAVRMEINGCHLTCSFKEKGCEFITSVSRMSDHEKECEYRLVPCTLCHELVVRKEAAIHERDTCKQRRIACPVCDQGIPFEGMNTHRLVTCPEETLQCVYCITHECPRKSLVKHYEVCPKIRVPCPYRKYGCSFTSERCEMVQHTESVNHLEIVCRYMDTKLDAPPSLLDGPFAVDCHAHRVVLCSDVKEEACHECEEYVEPEEDRGFCLGYRCVLSGCSYAMCPTCLPEHRLYKSRQNMAESILFML